MNINTEAKLAGKSLLFVRACLGVVALGLFVSGVTCYFLPWEAQTAVAVMERLGLDAMPFFDMQYDLIVHVVQGMAMLDKQFPEFFLGTDWLGFAHLMLAVLFFGALRDPVRNIWVVKFGVLCAVCLIPSAVLFSLLRGLPWTHGLVDASFGFGALAPLLLALREMGRQS